MRIRLESSTSSLSNFPIELVSGTKKKMELRRMSVIVLALTAMFAELAMATDYTIGGPNGWTMSANVQTWASSQTFHVGDNLVFQYPSMFHDVVEVSKAEFDNCQAIRPLGTYSNGNTVVPLTSPGKRYFICGMPGHCSQGMKLEINTLAAAPSANPSPEISPRAPQPTKPSLPNPSATPGASQPSILPPIIPVAAPEASQPSIVPPQTTVPLPLIPGLVPASSPVPQESSPLVPGQISPLIPVQSPDSSPAIPSLPLSPSSSAAKNTIGNLPSATTTTTTLVSSPPPPVVSSATKDTFTSGLVLGLGLVLMTMLCTF